MLGKSTKFLIIVGDTDYVYETINDRVPKETREKLHMGWDNVLRVIECIHPVWDDNLVTLPDENDDPLMFVRDINGILYYPDDYWTKADVINAFE